METKPEARVKRVTRIDSIPAANTSIDEQGFLHDTPVVTSTGIFEYALPGGKVRRELRLPEHVFDRESLASYSGKPVIITHEAGSIDKSNVMEEIVGTILSDGYQDGNNVRCRIVIHDIDKVKRIPFRELSLGYSLDLIEEPGEWNGEPYDAIQTNIRINHLAIVEKARAGEQAHLNLDGKSGEADDRKENKGGREEMQSTGMHSDSVDMTPEELVEAINSYKAARAGKLQAGGAAQPEGADGGGLPEGTNSGAEADKAGAAAAKQEAPGKPAGGPETAPPASGAANHDGNVGKLIEAVEALLTAVKGAGTDKGAPAAATEADGAEASECGPGEAAGNGDSSDAASQSMNNDAADTDFLQRLNICRVGDKLHLDGLERKSVREAKTAIVAHVFPAMRLDGKTDAYVDAAYDMAVNEVNRRKDATYQRQQMTAAPAKRADGAGNLSMASSARQRMIEREGGKE